MGGWRPHLDRLLELAGETRRVRPTGPVGLVVAAFSVIAVFLIGWLALFGIATQHHQVALFLVLLLPISFLTTTSTSRAQQLAPPDFALAVVGFAASGWFALHADRYDNWVTGFSTLSVGDTVAGVALFLLCIELCRRSVGIGLTAILFTLLAYVAFGQYLVGSFRHSGVTFDYFLEMQVVGTDGIFGAPLYVAASYAFLFVLFGNFYVASGGGQLFFDVAAALTGRTVGGPAKACVVSSGLYGMISGSPVADVATTGPVTIPVMKRIGISAERAGAIEAASSIGGAMMPPVMGAVAFMMSDFTGIPYYLICLVRGAAGARLLPRRVRAGAFRGGAVQPRPRAGGRDRRPQGRAQAQLAERRPDRGADVAAGRRLFGGLCRRRLGGRGRGGELDCRRETAIGPRRFIDACVDTCISMVPLTAAVAAAGIIIGCDRADRAGGQVHAAAVPAFGRIPAVLAVPGRRRAGPARHRHADHRRLHHGRGAAGARVRRQVRIADDGSAYVHAVLRLPVGDHAAGGGGGICRRRRSPEPTRSSSRPMPASSPVGGFVVPFFFVFNPGILMQGSVFKILSDTAVCSILVVAASLVLHGLRPATPDLMAVARSIRARRAGDGGAAARGAICGSGGIGRPVPVPASRRPAGRPGRPERMEGDLMRLHWTRYAAILAALLWAHGARADAIADFYRGKTVTIYVGFGPGGGYDAYAQLLAPHIRRHIPGEPSVIVKHMPGAGSLALLNYLWSVAAPDGTSFGIPASSAVFAPLIGSPQEKAAAKFNATGFGWLGSLEQFTPIGIAWHTTGFKTLAGCEATAAALRLERRGQRRRAVRTIAQ